MGPYALSIRNTAVRKTDAPGKVARLDLLLGRYSEKGLSLNSCLPYDFYFLSLLKLMGKSQPFRIAAIQEIIANQAKRNQVPCFYCSPVCFLNNSYKTFNLLHISGELFPF